MAQSVEHIVHIDGVVGSSPTVTTIKQSHPSRVGLFYACEQRARIIDRRRCEHIDWGAEPKRRQWRMKRGGSVVSKGEIPPLQGGIATIANLTERAKRSETVGSSPTVTTTAQPLKIKGCGFFALPRSRVPRGTFLSGSFGAHSQKYHIV